MKPATGLSDTKHSLRKNDSACTPVDRCYHRNQHPAALFPAVGWWFRRDTPGKRYCVQKVAHETGRTIHFGLVGYFYRQLSGDAGDGAVLGDFKSEVTGVGPEAGWFLKDGSWYASLKGCYEFDAKNRPQGWNLWLTLSLPLASDDQ